MRIPFLLLLPVLLTVLISCGRSEETELHHQASFSVRYLSLDQTLRAQASFWEASDSLQSQTLQIRGTVRFQDRMMTYREEELTDPSYLLEYRSEFPETLNLEIQFEDHPDALLSLKMDPIADFRAQFSRSEARGLVLEVAGGRLSGEESLVILLSDDQNTVHTFNIRGPSTSDTHRLTADQLAPLAPGQHTLFLVKKQVRQIRKAGLQASTLIEYFSTPREIELPK